MTSRAEPSVGVEAAAQYYYGVHVWQLDLAQSALIAGLLLAVICASAGAAAVKPLKIRPEALKLATDHPETGFPFAVYSTKVLTLLALNKPDEAEQFAKAAMTAAQKANVRNVFIGWTIPY